MLYSGNLNFEKGYINSRSEHWQSGFSKRFLVFAKRLGREAHDLIDKLLIILK